MTRGSTPPRQPAKLTRRLAFFTMTYPYPVLSVDLDLLEAVTLNMAGRCKYKLGAKAPDLDADSHSIKELDCSGFVRFAINRATGSRTVMPDGSAVQHEWCHAHGFKESTFDAGLLKDGALRIAFLPPKGRTPGHVMLILNGQTMECCGSRGVCRREWGKYSWMRSCQLFVLTAPTTRRT